LTSETPTPVTAVDAAGDRASGRPELRLRMGAADRFHRNPTGQRCSFRFSEMLWMDAMSDAVGPGDLVLCVNAAPNHASGRPVPLRAGETYRVVAVMEFACPCGRSDALLDVGVDFAWCQTRFRLLPKPKAEAKTRRVSAPKEKETVR
jgi:hypothetical protein